MVLSFHWFCYGQYFLSDANQIKIANYRTRKYFLPSEKSVLYTPHLI